MGRPETVRLSIAKINPIVAKSKSEKPPLFHLLSHIDKTSPPTASKTTATTSTMGGHHHYNPEAEPRKDQDLEAIKKAQIPIAWRDTCSHILIDLNKCRRDTWWNPNKCEHERHTYEECEYNAYLQRVEAKVQLEKHGK